MTWTSLATSLRKCRQELVSNIGAISDFNVENLSRGYVNEHGSPKERTPETTTGFDGGKSNRCSSDVNLRAV
jgi:hypothetical protein